MKIQHLCMVALLLAACTNNTTTENTAPAKDETAAASTTSQTEAPPVEDEKNGKVSFKLNDTLVRTNKTTGGDTDDNLGLFTEVNKSLSFGLYGDVPGRPHRGWLEFSLLNFKFEPATYTLSKDNYASFSRYETINAGGETDYSASTDNNYKGTEMSITFTRIEKDPQSLNGRDYLASGTFAVKLQNKVYSAAERAKGVETISITEGTFERIRIAGGPKAE